MTGLPYKTNSGGNTQKQAILLNNCSMPGGHSNLKKKYRHNRLLCSKNESCSSNAKLWRDTDIREFQEHPSILALLDSNQCKQSWRCHRLSKESFDQKKLDRQLTGQSSTPFMRATSNDNHSSQNHHKKGVT